jgi:hypothetical protein
MAACSGYASDSVPMSNVVNLNKYRKQKAKAEASKRADTNRRAHGRTKAERTREELQKRKLESIVDGARLDSPPDKSSDDS